MIRAINHMELSQILPSRVLLWRFNSVTGGAFARVRSKIMTLKGDGSARAKLSPGRGPAMFVYYTLIIPKRIVRRVSQHLIVETWYIYKHHSEPLFCYAYTFICAPFIMTFVWYSCPSASEALFATEEKRSFHDHSVLFSCKLSVMNFLKAKQMWNSSRKESKYPFLFGVILPK